jgi:chorismate synthase
MTLGTPIMFKIQNADTKPEDYEDKVPRPSHGDYSYRMKYGVFAKSGGGRASARETVARVAAGALAEQWLEKEYKIEITAFVSAVGQYSANTDTMDCITKAHVDRSECRCPDPTVSSKMVPISLI